MSRLLLFLLTNLAICLLISILFSLLGLGSILSENGVDINLEALLVMSALFGFSGSFISLALSKWMAKRSMGVRLIELPQTARQRWLMNSVAELAKRAGIAMPEVGIFDSNQINAFATGMFRNSALIAVSTGLLNTMTEDEAEAVLGHEIAHIANGDMVTMGLLQGVLNTFVIFFSRIIGFFIDRVVLKNRSGFGLGYYLSSIIAQVFLSILASIIAMWFSRRREFRADEGGAALAGKTKMIAALKRLASSNSQSELPGEFAAFGISGQRVTGFKRLFLSHPPLEERIRSLQEKKIL